MRKTGKFSVVSLYLVALDEPLSEILVDVASANPGVDDCRRLGRDALGIERRVQIPLREEQLELVVADRKVPVEEEHPLDATSPARAKRLPLLLGPGYIDTHGTNNTGGTGGRSNQNQVYSTF